MTANDAAIRKAYQVAEDKDVVGWVNCFTKDRTFTDQSIGVTYRSPNELGRPVNCYPSGTVILAQLGVLPNLEAAVTQQERHVLNSGAPVRVAPVETQGEVT
jgi:hypothetical protein